MNRTFRLLAACAAAATLAACSTPQVALDQANNGVGLTQNLQDELALYARNAKLSAGRRLSSVATQDAATVRMVRDNDYETYLSTKAGKDPQIAAQDRIRDASDTYLRLLIEEQKARAEIAARLPGLVQDLPSPAEKLNAVQKTLADLGTELSASERLAVVTKFLKDAKDIASKNRQQAEGSAAPPAAAASAPAANP
ncbi:hypothetical protein [Ramlibacter sp. AN1133]|uniref:hypothetical protein n=1 Tax=Ramlibacter sp. AN1133 TaxID=3133429 RepID=UPI0030BFC56B